MNQLIIYISCGIAAVFSILAFVAVLIRKPGGGTGSEMARGFGMVSKSVSNEIRDGRQENMKMVQSGIKTAVDMLLQTQRQTSSVQDTRLAELATQLSQRQAALQATVTELMKRVDARIETTASGSQKQLDAMRGEIEKRLWMIQEDNGRKLEQMRATVDEKLQKTLETRLGESFRLVSDRLEQVYKGLGEMQTLAGDVGDLKKVLSNVKTRGVLGEVQLGALLGEILAPEQYATNVATKKGSQCNVEYAVKLPGNSGETVWLPVDAKFPADAYAQLTDAYESGDPAAAAEAGTALERRIKLFAKEIRDKYIDPPHTTDFAVMFLPFEGLYSEVARRGLTETLQRDYRVSVAGPSTMAAMLNSLQMGFRTLAIQKRSGEVWQVLGAVKTEFEKFSGVLQAAQQKLNQANSELDKLVGVRTRQIQRRLDAVSLLEQEQDAAESSRSNLHN